jgi:hypothetical protein
LRVSDGVPQGLKVECGTEGVQRYTSTCLLPRLGIQSTRTFTADVSSNQCERLSKSRMALFTPSGISMLRCWMSCVFRYSRPTIAQAIAHLTGKPVDCRKLKRDSIEEHQRLKSKPQSISRLHSVQPLSRTGAIEEKVIQFVKGPTRRTEQLAAQLR